MPLVLLNEPCVFRSIALKTLGKAGKPYRIVVQTPHLTDLAAAVVGGLGVTCRTQAFARQSQTTAIKSSLLPRLAKIAFTLKVRGGVHPVIGELEAIIRQAVAEQM